MDQIQHKFLEINGLKLHVAETGSSSSPAVVFLHGFPEIWYSWRHQMTAVANAGYRAIAPDWRGYGLSDPPPQPEKFCFADIVGDLVGILDSLGIDKAFLVAKDFGSMIAYPFAACHPSRVIGIVSIGIPHTPFGTGQQRILKDLPEGFYANRWQEPGRAEADFGRLDAKTVVRNIYILFSGSELPTANENQEIMDLVSDDTPLPSWFTEDDLSAYGELYRKSGFINALQVPYRKLGEDFDVDPVLKHPVLLIAGEKDYVLKMPAMEEYIRGGMVKHLTPNMETKYIPEGSHFVQEQFPEQINPLILAFLGDH